MVDSQIYLWCLLFFVVIVDKFVRFLFELCVGSIFGNVDYYYCVYGYYRDFFLFVDVNSLNGIYLFLVGMVNNLNYVSVNRFLLFELIIQDEFYLIEGLFGSLVGLYEIVVDELCSCEGYRVKYIVLMVIVIWVIEQVQLVFIRKLLQFLLLVFDFVDRFFLRIVLVDLLNDRMLGRLYVGICVFGCGLLILVIRIWVRFMQIVYEFVYKFSGEEIDSYWILIGYFNVIREFVGVRVIYWQDILERLKDIVEGGNV